MPCTVSRSSSARCRGRRSRPALRPTVGAEHEVAEHALLGLLVDQARAQLVHREGEHVGRPSFSIHCCVELGDGVLVDGLDAQLGQRVHPHPVHHEAAQPRPAACDVELDGRTR